MSKWPLLLIFMLISLLGCKSDGIVGSDNLIPRSKMIEIMADAEVVEAQLRFQQTRITNDSLQKVKIQSYDSLYMFYKLTPDQFNQSLKYYQEDLVNFEGMIDEVILLITKDRDSVLNIKEVGADSTLVVADSSLVK